ncbi:MAG: GbsR/MarR family transcriptional regulator [Longimicrobiales bacterium]
MDGRRQTFVEKMGLLFEADGMPRIAGRMLGELLHCDAPQSLDGLAGALKVSKASASVNARLLERVGAAERITKPGDRRDYYRVAPDMAARMLEIRLARVEKLRGALAEGVEVARTAESRARLEALERFHGEVIDALGEVLTVWRADASASERRRALAG